MAFGYNRIDGDLKLISISMKEKLKKWNELRIQIKHQQRLQFRLFKINF